MSKKTVNNYYVTINVTNVTWVISPKTNRPIKVGGPTFHALTQKQQGQAKPTSSPYRSKSSPETPPKTPKKKIVKKKKTVTEW